MGRSRTLAEMRTVVRNRTNLEFSTFVTDDEIDENLNEEYAELIARLISNEGQPHFVSTTTLNITQGTTLYPLPSDFWRLLRIVSTFDGITRDMEPFMEGERAGLLNTEYFSSTFSPGPRYRLQADNIEILPVSRAFTVELRYIHSCPILVDDADTADGYNGYEQAMIAGACALVREKEQTDPSFFERRKDRIYQLIDAWAHSRDASHPERVTDVVGTNYYGDWWIP